MSRESYAEAIGFYERALALDPRSVAAQSSLATALAARVLSFITDTAEADILRAEGLAQQALAASPAAQLRISPKARCCAHSVGTRRPFPNTRRCSLPIATG